MEISSQVPQAGIHTPSSPPTPTLPLPPTHTENTPPISAQWQNEWQQAQAELERNRTLMQSSPGPKVEILRVNQLDAIKLDQEINEVLKMQFMKIFSFMKVSFF